MKKAWLIALMALSDPMASQAAAPDTPKLIVVISVDQFSADLFAEYRQTYVAGLKRLANGVVFPSGYQSHAATETCPGHATILTGSHPGRAGIVANQWIDYAVTRGKSGSHTVYCAEDERQPGTTASTADYVVSPIHLRVPTMGDRMKQADLRSRVVSIAGKDRAAVMMGGHLTDSIWYFDPKKAASFVTLPDRDQTPPAVVRQVNARVAALMAKPVTSALPPACAAKSVPLKAGPGGNMIGVLANPEGRFRATPEFDRATADIAIGLLRSMQLGMGPAPDLLAIGLSANDYVGHHFGTAGAEMCAQQVALDHTVGRILAALDATGVPYAVVLTADHGGSDASERQAQRGFPDAGLLDHTFNLNQIGRELAAEFKLDIDGNSLLEGADQGDVLPAHGLAGQGDVYLSHTVSAALRPRLLAAAKAKMLAFPQVQAVFIADEVANATLSGLPVEDWTLMERAHASYDRARSGDLLVFLRPRSTPALQRAYTATHGSPWNYDRRVPMLFAYPGMIPHEQPMPVETVDILPTLAALIGLKVPREEIDGRCIDLDAGPGNTCPKLAYGALRN